MSAGRHALAFLVPAWMAACSGGSDAAPSTTSGETIAERFDEDAVVEALTELTAGATTLGLTPRAAELFFDGCGNNEADEQVFGGRPMYFYRAWAAVDSPIGSTAGEGDVDRVGEDAAQAAGWSEPSARGVRQREDLTMRYRSLGPRLVIEVSGPCLEVVDEDAARAHAIGDGRKTLAVAGAVALTDEPLPLGDGTYLPAGDPEVTVPDG